VIVCSPLISIILTNNIFFRSFIVSMSNNTIVTIPETAFEVTDYSTFKHTSKIVKLICSEDSDIYGVCEQGGIYRFKIDNGAISG
jgi:hypothetical protein